MKRHFSIALFFVLSAPVTLYGQSLFEDKTTLLTRAGQRDFLLADDFDNDGDQDLLVLQPSNDPDKAGGIYYLLYNNEEGDFSEELLVSTDSVNWENIRTGDLNNDGLQDIIYYRFEDEQVVWLRNQGAGDFALQDALLTNYLGGVFEIEDVTGDSLDDIVYMNFDDEPQLLLQENQGNEAFSEPQVVASGELVHIADFDADGLPDLFTLDSEGSTIIWHRNNGDGTYTANTTNVENESPFATPNILVADFAGDATNELIISYPVGGETGTLAPKLYSFDENEEFIFQSSLSDPETFNLSPSNVSVNDIDQDGDLDMLASFKFALAFSRIESDYDEYVGWYENTGNFQFAPRLLDNALLEGSYIDLNSDQQLDIILDASGELIWMENLGQAVFADPGYLTNQSPLVTSFLDEEVTNINFGDINQDGLPELIVSEGISNKIQYFANDSEMLASSPSLLTLTTLKPTDVAIFEASGDEENDVIVVGGDVLEGLDIYRYTTQEDFSWEVKDTLYSGLSDTELMIGDFDGDTRMDIAFSEREQSVDGEIIILLNQNFEALNTEIIGTIQAVYDINGDGKTDIITEDGIYSQNQEGEFELIRSLDFSFSHASDINGDSLLDFLLVSEVEVTLYLAGEDESYQEQTLTFEGDYDFTATPWLLIDIDNDQDKDLVFIHDTGANRKLAFLRNTNGTTTFSGYTVIDSFNDTNFRLYSHDIDQDTDTDLVILTDTELAWYKSNAYGEEFPPENSVPVVANPIEDQQVTVNEEFIFTIADSVFQDADEGDTLTLSVMLTDSTDLPDWLNFDPQTNTLSGTPPKAGLTLDIRITATDSAAASVSDEFTITVTAEGENPVASLENDLTEGVGVYPVPASGELFLESQKAYLQSYQLLDIQGRMVSTQQLNQQESARIRVDISSLKKGVYLLKIQTREQTYQRRVLIE
uniref:FG-GAP-like repeat-containing protein n=1 Tax=Roseihalotalea indica TaxID=2867963 RepID=A0AA49GRT3_9BACT|nr:FG-GAP-like repeat-containing protein [Tunicatimonas sp. TK19036]